MFGVDSTELLVVAVIALLVIGPKDLPKAMRTVGQWVGRARGMARHFRSGFETMMREAELEEMEKKWREENERIMREHPALPSWDAPTPGADGSAAAPPPADPAPEAEPSPPAASAAPPEGEMPPPRSDEDPRELP
ncbi:MAG TPA: Sec-independent protein translocase protein TatB [Allosphingosinicella sp.]|jgi:sec-independent protein translocase protein TatB